MSKEKQIEEMAKDVTYSIVWHSDEYATVDCLATAKKLHLKGYRKQSEVIYEFVKRLKEEMNNLSRMEYNCDPYFLVSEAFIDKIAEKMKGGTE